MIAFQSPCVSACVLDALARIASACLSVVQKCSPLPLSHRLRLPAPSVCLSCSTCGPYLKHRFCQTNPILDANVFQLKRNAENIMVFGIHNGDFHSSSLKPIQSYSRLFQPIQGVFGKKRSFIFLAAPKPCEGGSPNLLRFNRPFPPSHDLKPNQF
jgi:hypothetical protein